MNKLNPVETYTPPQIPTLASKPNLCELPKRWAKNAAVVACIGVLGASALFGTHAAAANERPTPQYATSVLSERSEYAMEIRWFHGGGFGGGSFYVVHLSEQQMQDIVREELEAAGLRMNSPPPALTTQNRFANVFTFGLGIPEVPVVRINMFDMRRRVGVALVPWGANNSWFVPQTARRFARNPALALTEVGVFYNPTIWSTRPYSELTPDYKQEIGAQQAEHLRRQAQDFITTLQQRGRLR